VTISIGTATIIPSESDQIQKFILAADQALYLAKGSGRNQYRLAQAEAQLRCLSQSIAL
jgi:Response regulator containing a CheY-like receiver domain and a GGDEF domain